MKMPNQVMIPLYDCCAAQRKGAVIVLDANSSIQTVCLPNDLYSFCSEIFLATLKLFL